MLIGGITYKARFVERMRQLARFRGVRWVGRWMSKNGIPAMHAVRILVPQGAGQFEWQPFQQQQQRRAA